MDRHGDEVYIQFSQKGSDVVGDVFWAPFPFADSDESKMRPVVVVADAREGDQMDWVVCSVTSQEPSSLAMAIRIFQTDLQEGSLDRVSWARPNRLQTIDEGRFISTIGRLTDGKTAEIIAAVRSLF